MLSADGARDRIMARIRAAIGKDGSSAAQDVEAVRAQLREHRLGPRPPFDWPDPVAQFKEQAVVMSSSVAEVGSPGDVPAAVAHYLEDLKLDKRAVCWPAFAGMDWRAAGVQMESRTVRDGDLVGVTGAYCGIAETGTLMLLSGAQTPAAMSLLPDTHIAVLPVARIVPAMEEAWNLLRHEHAHLQEQEGVAQSASRWPPRSVNFVSGPSRSGDIEMQIVLGVHGPYRVHIILVKGGATPRELIHTDWWRVPQA
jgi:L-lactate dehydrogenase complex protein LldG